ncbi:VOC family protein [Micrococcaceae bacterium Sec5.7]
MPGTSPTRTGSRGRPRQSEGAQRGDLDVVIAQMQASGVEVIQEPAKQPYGVRDCAFRDPAGNLIRINALPLVGHGRRSSRWSR